MTEAWFSALGQPLSEVQRNALLAYLSELGIHAPISAVGNWEEAGELCRKRSDRWWNAEEAERARLEQTVRLDPTDPEWLALNETLHSAAAAAARRAGCVDAALVYAAAGAASYAAYHERLARAAAVPAAHPFHRKYALYCAGHWPLGLYDAQFRIF